MEKAVKTFEESTYNYERLRIAASDARLDAEIARLELEQHERNHATAN